MDDDDWRDAVPEEAPPFLHMEGETGHGVDVVGRDGAGVFCIDDDEHDRSVWWSANATLGLLTDSSTRLWSASGTPWRSSMGHGARCADFPTTNGVTDLRSYAASSRTRSVALPKRVKRYLCDRYWSRNLSAASSASRLASPVSGFFTISIRFETDANPGRPYI